MLSDILALESLVGAAAGTVHSVRGVDPVERAVVRLAASRTSSRVLDAARELHGAAAFAGDTESARRWTDSRALTLLDGSDLALESFIILEGTRELRRQSRSTHDAQGILEPIRSLVARTRKELEVRLRQVAYGGPSSVRLRELGEHTVQLYESVQLELRRHGEELVEMQHVQRRLATILMELSTWFALAMRVDAEVRRHGETGSQRMIEAAEIWISSADSRVKVQFAGLAENDDAERDRIASRAYADQAYPFDIF
jgi:acyl-CoA dehydrogenase family protein 9